MRFSILFLSIMFVAVVAQAQSKDEQSVAIAVEELRSAMEAGDSVRLKALVMDELSYGHSSGHIDNKNEFIEKLVSGKSDFVSIGLKDQTILVSGHTAIVRHILDATTNDGGKPGEVHLRIMLVWQKQKGRWKLLARQAVKI